MSAGYHIVPNVEIGRNGIRSPDKSHGGTWAFDQIRSVRPYADRSLIFYAALAAGGFIAISSGGWGILGGLLAWLFLAFIIYSPRRFVLVTLQDGYVLWLRAPGGETRGATEKFSAEINNAMEALSRDKIS